MCLDLSLGEAMDMVITNINLQEARKKEEEFSMGPLLVLMMSVKNNTQEARKKEEEFSMGPLLVLMMSVKNNTQIPESTLEASLNTSKSFLNTSSREMCLDLSLGEAMDTVITNISLQVCGLQQTTTTSTVIWAIYFWALLAQNTTSTSTNTTTTKFMC